MKRQSLADLVTQDERRQRERQDHTLTVYAQEGNFEVEFSARFKGSTTRYRLESVQNRLIEAQNSLLVRLISEAHDKGMVLP
jgi:hypothetical protein